jgi:curved DNA-binding protein CbpA
MTDYFALLDQPRTPWLDPTALKDVFHRKTLRAHPDAAGGDDANFAELNEAFQVLQDPKRRLHHLLSLEKCAPPAGNQTVPQDLQDLFLLIGASTQRANTLLEKTRTTSNALGRSLLKPEVVEMQKEIGELGEKVRGPIDSANAQLRELHSEWRNNFALLTTLYFKFAYLGRWSAQLDELAFQLAQL